MMDKKQRLDSINERIEALDTVIRRMQERVGKCSRFDKHGVPVNARGESMLPSDETRILRENVRLLDELYEQAERLEE